MFHVKTPMRAVFSAAIAVLCAAPLAGQGFTYTRSIDAMTDRDQSRISTTSVGSGDEVLVLRCDGSADVDLIILAGDYLTTTGSVSVQLRFDTEAAGEPEDWNPSTVGSGVFAPPERLVALAERMKTASRLRVRLADFRGTPHDTEFRLTGFSAALSRLNCYSEFAKRLAETKRAADSTAAARAAFVADVLAAPFIGNPSTMSYFANTNPPCIQVQQLRTDSRAVIFPSHEAARAAGFIFWGPCSAP